MIHVFWCAVWALMIGAFGQVESDSQGPPAPHRSMAQMQMTPVHNDGPSPKSQPETDKREQDQFAAPAEDLFEQFERHLPDPEMERRRINKALADIRAAANPTPEQIGEARRLEDLLKHISRIDRPQKFQLTLADALHRTLQSSHAIRVSSYNPAIATTRVVEAEAAFDAVFFTDITNQKTNQPTPSALIGSNIEQFTAASGIRKLLPTGMQVETQYNIQRSSNDFQFQIFNPTWTNNFVVSFSQPLMRGFGVDFNRSQIRVQRLNRRQSTQQFKREVREVLRNVEQAYWRLVQARRALVVSARLLASFQDIYDSLDRRKEYDVYTVQLSDSKARLERSRADFLRRVVDVRNAEDQIIALMNDGDINLADEIQLIPVDFPSHRPVITDRLADIQSALDNRAEIEEARLAVDIAKLQIGVAENQALPRADATFSYTVAGLGRTQHDAFSEVTKNDFHTYVVGFNFEIPLGNRGPRAVLARAKLEHGQSIANLENTIEQIIFEVNRAVREVDVTHDQIEPTLQAANATEEQVRSIIARAERMDFLTLNNELNTRTSLAQNQTSLLGALVDFAIANIDLERAKGTLLQYDGIELDPGYQRAE